MQEELRTFEHTKGAQHPVEDTPWKILNTPPYSVAHFCIACGRPSCTIGSRLPSIQVGGGPVITKNRLWVQRREHTRRAYAHGTCNSRVFVPVVRQADHLVYGDICSA